MFGILLKINNQRRNKFTEKKQIIAMATWFVYFNEK